MSSEEPNLITDIVHRGRETSVIGLFELDGLGINHLGLQGGIDLVQLVSQFLQSREGREIGRASRVTSFNRIYDRFIPDNIL